MKPGELIASRFQLQEVAGTGAMGIVWRATDLATGAPVAVKILRAGGENERFAREARLLAELDHPAIVRYVAHGHCDEGPFLAMEWLEGESLGRRLERAELRMGESVGLVGRIASAIGAAHRRFVVHRDLKPSNVFLVGKSIEDPRVVDFGVARHGTASDLTRTGMIVGSPRYMAPEQARGEREVGPQADVWALGAILFRCLTGRPLTQEGPVELVLSELLLSPVPRLSDVMQAPAALDEALARMLAKDPADRLPDGLAVAEALARLELPVEGSELPVGEREPESLTLAEQRFTCMLLVDALGEHLRELGELAKNRGATLDRRGDKAALVFATLGTASDLVAHAARCALEVHALAPSARIAIATGSGSSGQSRADATLLARAELLLGRATPGVFVDAAVVGLLEPRFQVVHEAESAKLLRERDDTAPLRRLLGKPTPCVGRERELGALEGLVTECLTESVARAALLTGPPGIGKSRLRYELLRRLARAAVEQGQSEPAVFIGRADAVAAGSPFGVLGGALRSGLGLELGEPAIGILRERLGQHPERERIAGHLAMLAGISRTEDALEPTIADAVLIGDQLQASFEAFLEAELAERAVLFVLEDLHWGDWPSVRLLDAALRLFRDRPLFVLGIGRPEVSDRFPALWQERGAIQLPLTELGTRASERLVRAVLGDAADPAVVAEIAERAGGNAFFLEELIRAVAAGGERAALPESVRAMAESRIAALEPEARQVLRAASIFGHVFWSGGATALMTGSRSGAEVRSWLERLTERELITRRKSSRFAGEQELIFRHALVRDAAYAMLTEPDRVLGHRLAAEWLEQAREQEALRLAEHWRLGGEPARAGPLYARAAEQALEGNDFAAALAHAACALACGVTSDVAGAVHLTCAAAHRWRGETEEYEAAARRARATLPRLSRRWYVAASETARIASRLGRHEELSELFDELAADTSAERASSRAVVLAQIGVSALRAGRSELWQRIQGALARTEDALGADDHEGHAWLSRLRGYAALVEGDAAAYLRHTERAVASFVAAKDERNAITFQTSVGFALIALGRHAEAEEALVRALGRAERMNLALTSLIARHNLGFAVALGGRLEEGIAIERRALSDAKAQGDRWVEAVSETYLAALYLRAGDLEAARASAERAIELSDRPNRALGLALRARAELAEGALERAHESARQAFELVEELGGIEDGDALVRLTWAEVLERSGENELAAGAFAAAHARLLERARKISDEELRKSFLENVPEHAETLRRARS